VMRKPDVTGSREEDFLNSSYRTGGSSAGKGVKFYNVPFPQDVHEMAVVAKTIRRTTLRDYIIDAVRRTNEETLKEFSNMGRQR